MISLEMAAALADLTEQQREAFVDHILVGRTLAEIAETMGCTTQNVSNHIRRARVQLARRLVAA